MGVSSTDTIHVESLINSLIKIITEKNGKLVVLEHLSLNLASSIILNRIDFVVAFALSASSANYIFSSTSFKYISVSQSM